MKMSVMTRDINSAQERPHTSAQKRPHTIPDRRAIPWFTLVVLSILMAYADGFWVTSLRLAVGAIERTQAPFASWMQESTLLLPIFVLAVLGAFVLARHWLGPELARPRTTLAGALIIVAAGTLVGIAALAASSAYDYHLQSAQSVSSVGAMAAMTEMSPDTGAALRLQVRAVAFGSGILLVTNLIVVGLTVGLRGGRLEARTTRQRTVGAAPRPGR